MGGYIVKLFKPVIMGTNIKVNFKIIEKEELRTLFLEYVADAETNLKRARTHSKRRHLNRVIQIFGSEAAYLTELIDND